MLKLKDEYLNLEEKNMPTPHNEALANDFAKTVLMPGDPLRAKYIAENFLTDVKQVNGVRNMFGYTGCYNGKKVSVMGSGMGIPSISLYAYERSTLPAMYFSSLVHSRIFFYSPLVSCRNVSLLSL